MGGGKKKANLPGNGLSHPLQVLLVPNVDFIPIYQGPGLPEYMLNEFLRFRCQQLQYPSIKQELPEECRRHTFSISAVLNNGALCESCSFFLFCHQLDRPILLTHSV